MTANADYDYDADAIPPHRYAADLVDAFREYQLAASDAARECDPETALEFDAARARLCDRFGDVAEQLGATPPDHRFAGQALDRLAWAFGQLYGATAQ